MTTDEYKAAIIRYLKDDPSDEALEAIAEIVDELTFHHYIDETISTLHTAVFGPPWECVECGQQDNWFSECWSCDEPRPATDQESDIMGEAP